jgi:MYXO-CTERM domain-containing protein
MSTDDLERDIELTREHLGETVDALAAKLDVKSRAQDAVSEADNRKIAGFAIAAALVVGALLLWRRRN